MSAPPGLHTLVAELTYRCPLRCGYCSNPVDAGQRGDRLTASDWDRVFREAAALGALQVHLTGGEPLVRHDLEEIVRSARAADLYVNLITSGLPLTWERLQRLAAAGLDAVQLSLQSTRPDVAKHMAGRDALAQKLDVARWVRALELPLILNVVLHRDNIDEVPALIDLAEQLDAERLELANVQLLGWALPNRAALLPNRQALERARDRVKAARANRRRPEIAFVLPDHWADRPRACMDGWAAHYLVVSPDGLALPCLAAHGLPGLSFDNVLEQPLRRIWDTSPAFERYRGYAWMPEPCRSCDRRSEDFGGCRCQAFRLTGMADATDPACPQSPHHHIVLDARKAADDMSSLEPGTPRRIHLRTITP